LGAEFKSVRPQKSHEPVQCIELQRKIDHVNRTLLVQEIDYEG